MKVRLVEYFTTTLAQRVRSASGSRWWEQPCCHCGRSYRAKYPVLDTHLLRDRYLRADPGFTKLHLLDTQIRMEEGSICS